LGNCPNVLTAYSNILGVVPPQLAPSPPQISSPSPTVTTTSTSDHHDTSPDRSTTANSTIRSPPPAVPNLASPPRPINVYKSIRHKTKKRSASSSSPSDQSSTESRQLLSQIDEWDDTQLLSDRSAEEDASSAESDEDPATQSVRINHFESVLRRSIPKDQRTYIDESLLNDLALYIYDHEDKDASTSTAQNSLRTQVNKTVRSCDPPHQNPNQREERKRNHMPRTRSRSSDTTISSSQPPPSISICCPIANCDALLPLKKASLIQAHLLRHHTPTERSHVPTSFYTRASVHKCHLCKPPTISLFTTQTRLQSHLRAKHKSATRSVINSDLLLIHFPADTLNHHSAPLNWKRSLLYFDKLDVVPFTFRKSIYMSLDRKTKYEIQNLAYKIYYVTQTAILPHINARNLNHPPHETNSSPLWKLTLLLEGILLAPPGLGEPRNYQAHQTKSDTISPWQP